MADADTAKAAQWWEQGIMDAKSESSFKPEGWMPKFKTIEVWKKAFPNSKPMLNQRESSFWLLSFVCRGTFVNKLLSFWKVLLELLLRPVFLCYTTASGTKRRNCPMKEVKPSKKPLAIYYAIVLAVLLLLNLVLLPWMSERQVEEVDYGTFMSMTEDKEHRPGGCAVEPDHFYG